MVSEAAPEFPWAITETNASPWVPPLAWNALAVVLKSLD